MELEELFWVIVPFLGIFMGFVAYFKQKKEEKKAKDKNVPVAKEAKRIKQSELGFFRYLHFVYFVRSKLRPASTLLFFLFGFMWGFMGIYGNTINYYEPIVKLENMKTDTGIMQKINLAKKGRDTLELLHKNGTVIKYTVGFTRNEKKVLFSKIGKKVKVYYQVEKNSFLDGIYTIEYNGKMIKGKRFKYNYQDRLDGKQENLSNIIFWSIYNLIFFLWMFYFNYKEKPIHRLNRIRKLHGKQMAM